MLASTSRLSLSEGFEILLGSTASMNRSVLETSAFGAPHTWLELLLGSPRSRLTPKATLHVPGMWSSVEGIWSVAWGKVARDNRRPTS